MKTKQEKVIATTQHELDDKVEEMNLEWPYRSVEANKITYFNDKKAALEYDLSNLTSRLEYFEDSKWYVV